ncbi:MAG: hypothetical protein ACREN8_06385 [Candidatus Dormibacteraceae bacterium]
MIEHTILEQQRVRYWSSQRRPAEVGPQDCLRTSDHLMSWLEECLQNGLPIVPGWLMPQLISVLGRANPHLTQLLGRERRPAQLLGLLYRAQAHLMEESRLSREPARVIPLFR